MDIKILQNKDFICKAFGLDELQYGQMVYNVGQWWIDKFFIKDPLMVDVLNNSCRFWAWWKNQWNNRDAEFVRLTSIDMINEPLTGYCYQAALELYNTLHESGAREIHPNRFVQEEVNAMIIEEEQKILKLRNNEQ